MAEANVSEIDRKAIIEDYGNNRRHPHDEKRDGDWDCHNCKLLNADWRKSCKICKGPRPDPIVPDLDMGCAFGRHEQFKTWIQCPDCPAEFQLVSCLFRHSAVVHYNKQLKKSFAGFMKPSFTKRFCVEKQVGKKRISECPYCQEDLGFRIGWDSRPEKKNLCWIQHLGFKHRMILNHMRDEIFEEFNDILRADERSNDRGFQIPCLACTKKFMCTSNYVNHLIQQHYREQIERKYHLPIGCFQCPVCKMNPPNEDNRSSWLHLHLGKAHGLLYEFAEDKIVNQLQKLGFEQK